MSVPVTGAVNGVPTTAEVATDGVSPVTIPFFPDGTDTTLAVDTDGSGIHVPNHRVAMICGNTSGRDHFPFDLPNGTSGFLLPIALVLSDAMKYFHRVKSWRIDGNIPLAIAPGNAFGTGSADSKTLNFADELFVLGSGNHDRTVNESDLVLSDNAIGESGFGDSDGNFELTKAFSGFTSGPNSYSSISAYFLGTIFGLNYKDVDPDTGLPVNATASKRARFRVADSKILPIFTGFLLISIDCAYDGSDGISAPYSTNSQVWAGPGVSDSDHGVGFRLGIGAQSVDLLSTGKTDGGSDPTNPFSLFIDEDAALTLSPASYFPYATQTIYDDHGTPIGGALPVYDTSSGAQLVDPLS